MTNDSAESFNTATEAEARLCLRNKVHDAQRPASDLGLVLRSDTCRLLFRTVQSFIYQLQQKNNQNSSNQPPPTHECEFQAGATTWPT